MIPEIVSEPPPTRVTFSSTKSWTTVLHRASKDRPPSFRSGTTAPLRPKGCATWTVLAGTTPDAIRSAVTAPGAILVVVTASSLILAAVTAPFLILAVFTAFFFSCLAPTLFAARPAA